MRLIGLCIVWLWSLGACLQAQNPVMLRKESDFFLVGEHIRFLEDKTGKLTIEDILTPKNQARFSTFSKKVFTKPPAYSAYWIALEVRNATSEDAWLEIGSSFVWYADFYAPDHAKQYKKIAETGACRPHANKLKDVNLFWLPLNRARDTVSRTYYLRAATERAYEIPLSVGTLSSLYRNKAYSDFIVASFLGVVAISFLYNFFVFLQLRDRLYLFYSFFLLTTFFLLPFSSGYPFVDNVNIGILQHETWHTYIAVWQAPGFATVMIFGMAYLQMRTQARLFYFMGWGVMLLLCGVIPCLRLLGISHTALAMPSQILLLLNNLVPMLASYYLLWKGHKNILPYSIGWTFFLISLVTYLLTLNGVLPFNPFTRNALYFGTALEIWMFSLALGNRYSHYRQELLAKSIENEQLMQQQNELLERKVQERTEDLEKAYKKIWRTNDKLTAMNEQISNTLEELRESEALTSYKGELLSAIAAATDKLLKISDSNTALFHIFPIVGKAANVDRMYYFENSRDADGHLLLNQRITWAATDNEIRQELPQLQGIKFDLLGTFSKEIREKKFFNAIVAHLPEGLFKKRAKDLGAKSLLILPVTVGGEVYGFIGFDDCQKERVWLAEEIAILQSLAANMATAIERNLADKELKTTQNQLVESEKMAILGQLIAGIAHEINNPLGAIKASSHHIKNVLENNLPAFPEFCARLSPEMRLETARLILHTAQKDWNISTKEERRIKREWRNALAERDLQDTDLFIDNLLEMGLMPEQYADFQRFLDASNAEDLARQFVRFGELFKSTKIIITAVERAAKIVFALKKFSHNDTSDAPSPTNLQDTIETVLTLYYNQLKRGIDLQTDFQEVPQILGFADELAQVWTNLIYNAMQAMDFVGKLEIRIELVGKEVCVSVRDTGKGIPPEIKNRIFEAFFTTKPAGEGTGLGLSITRKIIEKHQGRIDLESEIGKGTTFKVFFPVP